MEPVFIAEINKYHPPRQRSQPLFILMSIAMMLGIAACSGVSLQTFREKFNLERMLSS